MRWLILAAVLLVGCSKSDDGALQYLKAAEMVRAEETRLAEIETHYESTNATYQKLRSLQIATDSKDPGDEKRSAMMSKLKDDVEKQREIVRELRAKRDGLAKP